MLVELFNKFIVLVIGNIGPHEWTGILLGSFAKLLDELGIALNVTC